jgi:hypothetical protein
MNMKKYYYHDGKSQQGPFDIEELKSKSLSKDTMIWFEGMPEWLKAETIEELKELFIVKMPPPLNPTPPTLQINSAISNEKQTVTTTNQIPYQKQINQPKSSQKRNIIIIASVLGGLLFLYIISQVLSSSSSTGGGSEETNPLVLEENNPEQYLNASGTYNQNFWGTKIQIQGYVENKAEYTNYKDVRIKITFYTETETEIGSENYIIYDYFPVGAKKEFKLKVEFPAGTKKCGWDAIGATVYSN